MKYGSLVEKLSKQPIDISLQHILDNSKADSGGERDVNFLHYLTDNGLLVVEEVILKRTDINFQEEYYSDKYKKMSFESDRHFYCRVIIQEELHKLQLDSFFGIDVGNMNILRSNSNYDIVTADFGTLIDIGFAPARNYFRGLTDSRTCNYLITPFFDEYMDDIRFACFTPPDRESFISAVTDYQEGFKQYQPAAWDQAMDTGYFDRS